MDKMKRWSPYPLKEHLDTVKSDLRDPRAFPMKNQIS